MPLEPWSGDDEKEDVKRDNGSALKKAVMVGKGSGGEVGNTGIGFSAVQRESLTFADAIFRRRNFFFFPCFSFFVCLFYFYAKKKNS